MVNLILIFIGGVITFVGEGIIANTVNSIGISGIVGILLTGILCGTLLFAYLKMVFALVES